MDGIKKYYFEIRKINYLNYMYEIYTIIYRN